MRTCECLRVYVVNLINNFIETDKTTIVGEQIKKTINDLVNTTLNFHYLQNYSTGMTVLCSINVTDIF